MKTFFTIVTLCCIGCLCASNYAAEFFIKDGDRVVFLGDSITEQGKPGETDRGGLYTVYVESYALTRFPKWNLVFRNVGIGGDSAMLLQRQSEKFDWDAFKAGDDAFQKKKIETLVANGLARDVLPLEPTLVTITFGMNDFGYQGFSEPKYQRFIRAENDLVNILRSKGSRIALFSPQPIEQPLDKPDSNEATKNAALRRFADGLREVATHESAMFVDQFDPYMALVRQARVATPPRNVGGSADAVHPGPPGHAIMAWNILKNLGATPVVSSAEIDAAREAVVSMEKCQISGVALASDGTLTFKRSDEALPMPIDSRAEPALKFVPILADLNRYILKVTGLKAARYNVLIDDKLAATVEATELGKGWNMATAQGPITAQAQQVMRLVVMKNATYFHRWKEVLLDPARHAALPRVEQQLVELESQLNNARLPKPHVFTLKPVNP